MKKPNQIIILFYGIIIPILIIGTLIFSTSCAKYIEAPNIEQAPYEISWTERNRTKIIYTNNYELGNSVTIEGYWTRNGTFGWSYEDNIIILEPISIIIKRR